MSELETKTEVEAENFTDELSDEALDRAEGIGQRGPIIFCGMPACVTKCHHRPVLADR